MVSISADFTMVRFWKPFKTLILSKFFTYSTVSIIVVLSFLIGTVLIGESLYINEKRDQKLLKLEVIKSQANNSDLLSTDACLIWTEIEFSLRTEYSHVRDPNCYIFFILGSYSIKIPTHLSS